MLNTFRQRVLSIPSVLFVASALSACSQKHPEALIPRSAVTLEPVSLNSAAPVGDLAVINEPVPTQGNQVWFDKQFWLGRKIWVSLGVERASVTGLAMSVIGYIPAEIERAGSSLVLKRQNTGLFGGSTLGPEFGLNAYPIVAENEKAILVDLASPKTPYGLSTVGMYAASTSATELAPRFEYLKSVEVKDTSVAFQSVLTAKSPQALFEKGDGSAESMAELDPYMLSVSLRTDWLTTVEAPKFNAITASDSIFGFFIDSPLVVNSGNDVKKFINHIDTSAPSNWTMSSNTPELYRESVKAGLEAWNEALGSKLINVSVADANHSFTDPSTSNVVWDDNEAVGMAFANWRSNPYTGQIVQAQIYMSGNMWANQGALTFKIRSLEKSIRQARAAAAAAANAQPYPGVGAGTGDAGSGSSPGTGSPATGTSVGGSPAAPTNSVTTLNQSLKQLQQEVSKLVSNENITKEPRRFFVGLNMGMASERAQSQNFCQRSLESNRQLLAQLKGMEVELKTLGTSLLIDTASSTESETNPPTTSPTNPAPAPANPPVVEEAHSPYPDQALTAEEFSKNVVRAVVMHEAGHTLGLRHNFVGSTGTSRGGKVQSASIMDYNDLVVDASFPGPGDSDMAIMKSVYDKDAPQAEVKFCTDEGARAGVPDCTMFDFGANPVDGLRVQQQTNLMIALQFLQRGRADVGVNMVRSSLRPLAPMANYVMFSTEAGQDLLADSMFAARQEKAWENLQASKTMLELAYPKSLHKIYSELVLQLITTRATAKTKDSSVFEKIVAEFKSGVLDDGFQLATRRAALAGLKKLQAPEARLAIVEAAAELQKRSSAAPTPDRTVAVRMADEEILTLVQRILTAGYFE